jgi:HD superfamily phosphohydrolase
MRLRDPIHGTITVDETEVALLDNRFFQRLRWVRQLGFGDLAFPGATHTRHAHSLGAMHVASRVFDQVFPPDRGQLRGGERSRLRECVRIAALFHDVGHMPLSHSSESIAPLRATLGLPSWLPGDEQASHEDFTAKILLGSELGDLLRQHQGGVGVTPEAVVSLIAGIDPPGGSPFRIGARDYGPALCQMVSGELDADRMDYLQRDSFFSGVNYGHFDMDWLIENLSAVEQGGRVFLAMSNAAIFAFEDFLLSRFHMFVSVYYHHTSVGFDRMLRRFYEESPGEFAIPSDPNEFAECDDASLALALRRSTNAWARRIVRREGYKLLVQVTPLDKGYDLPAIDRELVAANIEHFSTTSEGVLSKYFSEGGPPLFVVDHTSGRLTPVAEYTPLYQKYAESLRIRRVYCRPDQRDAALAIVRRLVTTA